MSIQLQLRCSAVCRVRAAVRSELDVMPPLALCTHHLLTMCLPPQVYEKRVASLAEFNLQNGSSMLNAGGRPGSGSGGPYSPDKLRAACTAAAAQPHALRIPRVVGTETLLATRCKRWVPGMLGICCFCFQPLVHWVQVLLMLGPPT